MLGVAFVVGLLIGILVGVSMSIWITAEPINRELIDSCHKEQPKRQHWPKL